MILRVRANQESFQEVSFQPGMNIVLADRTKKSTKKDSRNGLGKTTLLEIVHFCLGARLDKRHPLRDPMLVDWEFTIEVRLAGREIAITRGVDSPNWVQIQGEIEGLEASGSTTEIEQIKQRHWTEILGRLSFGLSKEDLSDRWSPSFRSLIGYFARRQDAFSDPFEHHRKQQKWDRQVNNAFLLGLEWRDARDLKALEEREKALRALKKAADTGLVEGMIGTLGELEAERVRLVEQIEERAERLREFKVHPEYRDIERRANSLTEKIHGFSNDNLADRRKLGFYESSIEEVDEAENSDLAELYSAIGVELPGAAIRRLDEVDEFHRTLLRNRQEFLKSEMAEIHLRVEEREKEIHLLSDERSELLVVLREHGALDEYARLQRLQSELVGRLNEVETRIRNLEKFEEGKTELAVERSQLHRRARLDYEERQAARNRAIRLFNANSQALYQAPGSLVIDVTDKGFQFDVEIQRAASRGIGNMKVFCYDLTLATLWAEKERSPGFLFHDSEIFDGVDERQVALALQRAAEISVEHDFQYICTLNSDAIPESELPDDFDLGAYVRLRLTDEKPEGSLLGIRF